MRYKLQLDFVNQSTFSLSSWTLAGLISLLAGLVFALFTWQHYENLTFKQNALSSKIVQMNRQLGHEKSPVSIVKSEMSSEQIQQIQITVGALTLPWNELLQGIEKADMQDIALLSLDPNSKKQQVTLSGEAKNLQTALSFIQKLEAQPMLEKVSLQKYNIDEANLFKPVKFTLIAQWLF